MITPSFTSTAPTGTSSLRPAWRANSSAFRMKSASELMQNRTLMRGVQRRDGNQPQPHGKKAQHGHHQRVHLGTTSGKFLPYQQSPKRADHGGALAQGVAYGRPHL